MNLSEKIINNVKILPESKQIQILDFVEYLKSKNGEGRTKGMERVFSFISNAGHGG